MCCFFQSMHTAHYKKAKIQYMPTEWSLHAPCMLGHSVYWEKKEFYKFDILLYKINGVFYNKILNTKFWWWALLILPIHDSTQHFSTRLLLIKHMYICVCALTKRQVVFSSIDIGYIVKDVKVFLLDFGQLQISDVDRAQVCWVFHTTVFYLDRCKLTINTKAMFPDALTFALINLYDLLYNSFSSEHIKANLQF